MIVMHGRANQLVVVKADGSDLRVLLTSSEIDGCCVAWQPVPIGSPAGP